MTQDVRDDSHAFLYKRGSEFKPLGITLSCNFTAWGAVARQLPKSQNTETNREKQRTPMTSPSACSNEFNRTSGEENGMLEHFDSNYKYY